MVGTYVSHYRVLELIGHGGMGDVYRAQDTRLRRQVALKFLSHKLERSRAGRDRFLEEARSAARLDHPNICPVYEIDETPEGHIYIVMACCEGRNLQKMMVTGPLHVGNAVAIGGQVAAGLGAAHDLGIIHRDIKPQNIIVADCGTTRIVDFGLATLATLATLSGRRAKRSPKAAVPSPGARRPEESSGTRPEATGRPCGTFDYMSPEQATGGEIDVRSDVFSLGVVLYEMVSGRRPFRASTPASLVRKICQDTPPPLADIRPEVPVELSNMVAKAISKAPESRFANGREMQQALRQFSPGATPA